MEEEFKSCTGVLLRADLTGHEFSLSANFCQKMWDGCTLLGQPSKALLAPHIKKLETYFSLRARVLLQIQEK